MPDAASPMLRFRVWYGALPRALRLLLTVNVVLTAAWLVLRFVPAVAAPLAEALALQTDASAAFRPWTLLTYAFFNPVGDFWGLVSFAFAMLWLYWLGREYEEVYGSHRLFGLYVLAALVGALAAVLLALAGRPGAYADAFGPALGLLCAVAAVNPRQEIGLFLIGVVPLKWVAIGFVVLDALLSPNATHLGAAGLGAVFGLAQRRDLDLASWARPLFRPRRARPAPTRAAPARRRSEPPEEAPPRRRRAAPRPKPARGGPSEVDRILDKILEQGYESLTDEERRILDDASRS